MKKFDIVTIVKGTNTYRVNAKNAADALELWHEAMDSGAPPEPLVQARDEEYVNKVEGAAPMVAPAMSTENGAVPGGLNKRVRLPPAPPFPFREPGGAP